jgi:8-oxo-dGTP diphosphatase
MKLATLCYIEKNDRYLMLHRIKKANDIHRGKWVGLGGKFEPGESPEECVIREVYEESGLTVINPALRGIMTFPTDGFDGEDWYVFLFHVLEFTGELKPNHEGNLAWVEKEKINDLPMHAGDYLFIKWMQEIKGVFSVKFYYDYHNTDVLKDYTLKVYGAERGAQP